MKYNLLCKTHRKYDAEIALDESSEMHKELSEHYQREFTDCSLDEICKKIAKRILYSDFTVSKLTEHIAKLEVIQLDNCLK